MEIPGIHHVTAIGGDPQRNIDFYTRVLGLRLVKITVNFDDPSSYHLYYGDWSGTPGTILTFFAWPNGRRGRHGIGQIGEITFAIPRSSLAFWLQHLVQQNIQYSGPIQRFGEPLLSLRDPDGILLELVASAEAESLPGWAGGRLSAEHTIRRIQSVTLWEETPEPTESLLTQTLGFRQSGAEESYTRYTVGEGGPGAYLQVRNVQGFWRAAGGVGTVHHVAWRAADDAEELAWREILAAAGINVTPQRDRQYFRSIYFREPGGVLFEIATDPPGFAIDEPLAELGQRLQLPPWLESRRAEIELALPPLGISGS